MEGLLMRNNKTFSSNTFIKILKNNILAFVLNLLITILSIILLIIFVSTGPILGKYTTSIFARMFLILFFTSTYFCVGLLLDATNNKKYDFFSGIIIASLGLGLWTYTISKTGMSLRDTPEVLSEYWILYNLYYSPFTIISFLLNISNISPLISLSINFLPTILFGFAIKYKRSKII